MSGIRDVIKKYIINQKAISPSVRDGFFVCYTWDVCKIKRIYVHNIHLTV